LEGGDMTSEIMKAQQTRACIQRQQPFKKAPMAQFNAILKKLNIKNNKL
jgi:hypothetical protein